MARTRSSTRSDGKATPPPAQARGKVPRVAPLDVTTVRREDRREESRDEHRDDHGDDGRDKEIWRIGEE